MLGFNDVTEIYCYFNSTNIFISDKPDYNYKKNIKLISSEIINKIKLK